MKAVRLLLAAVLLLGSPTLRAVDVPATPAGAQLSRWLDAMNSGERPKLEELLKQYRDPEGRTVEEWQRFLRQTGGFDLRKLEESASTSLSALVQERGSDQFARLTLEVEAAPPHLISRMSLLVAPRPPEFAIPRMSEADAVAAARARVADLAKSGRFSGTVLVAKNGKVLYAEAVGLADRDARAPNRLDTKFNLGSMNKMFTAVSIAQLAQQGKLRPSDPLGKFLPDYPNAAVRDVTIEQLLTHRGGTGDIFGPEFDAHIAELKDPRDYIALYGQRAPAFPPGSRFEYSNYGFVLLGAIVERVSGLSYYDYVRKNIYGPAGMTDSDSYLKTDKVPNMAAGYTSEEGPDLQSNHASRPMRGSPAGGGYSTVEDLLRFATALTSHRLLNAEYTALVTTGKTDAPGRGKYAWGFVDAREGDVRSIGHGGGAPGINAELRVFPASGYVVAVMANLDPPAATNVSAFIGARLPAAPAALKPHEADAREMLRRTVAIKSSAGLGQVPAVAEVLAARFRAAGFPAEDLHVLPLGETASLVVRYRGQAPAGTPKRRPIALLGHMDVVTARPEDWKRDPFTLIEENGYFYGRGTSDDKGSVVAITSAVLRLKAEGFVPTRDLVLVFTGDEETGMETVQDLLKNHRDLVDAEYALNGDAGGGTLSEEDGRPLAYGLQTAEKTYATFELTAKNPGGHSSLPRKDNAIYDLADALEAVKAYRFPVTWNDTTLAWFRSAGATTPGPRGEAMRRFAANPRDTAASDALFDSPPDVGATRTTCVATMLRAGHAENALPQSATATVNCRIFPGVKVEDVRVELQRLAGAAVTVTTVGHPQASDASPLRPDVLTAVTKVVQSMHPGVPVSPIQESGGTDGLHFRAAGIPSYGVGEIFMKESDVFAHGLDERIPVAAFYDGLEHWYRLLKEVAGAR